MKSNTSGRVRSIFVHLVLIFLSFLCLFFFYILIVNATRSHADLQKGFSALPGKYFLENLKNVANDGSFPMFRGILNSVVVSSCSAALCTYFSSLTAYGLYAYDFKMKKAAFTFIMAILVMPTQVTAMGFLRLITKMGMYDSLLPLIIPSIASPAVFYFMYSYLQSSLPLSLVEAARIDGANSRQIFGKITLPLIKPILAYTLITSLIGGIQMFDVPQILTNGNGNPDRTSMTVIMYLNKHLYSKNYGMAGALSVILFIVTAVLSIFVFNYITKDMEAAGIRKAKKKKAKEAK